MNVREEEKERWVQGTYVVAAGHAAMAGGVRGGGERASGGAITGGIAIGSGVSSREGEGRGCGSERIRGRKEGTAVARRWSVVCLVADGKGTPLQPSVAPRPASQTNWDQVTAL